MRVWMNLAAAVVMTLGAAPVLACEYELRIENRGDHDIRVNRVATQKQGQSGWKGQNLLPGPTIEPGGYAIEEGLNYRKAWTTIRYKIGIVPAGEGGYEGDLVSGWDRCDAPRTLAYRRNVN